jgi:hypothetical protein
MAPAYKMKILGQGIITTFLFFSPWPVGQAAQIIDLIHIGIKNKYQVWIKVGKCKMHKIIYA